MIPPCDVDKWTRQPEAYLYILNELFPRESYPPDDRMRVPFQLIRRSKVSPVDRAYQYEARICLTALHFERLTLDDVREVIINQKPESYNMHLELSVMTYDECKTAEEIYRDEAPEREVWSKR